MEKTIKPDIKSDKITERINATALAILENSPEGVHWSELNVLIKNADPKFHPKTINGCVWKLVGDFFGY